MREQIYLSLLTLCVFFSEGIGTLLEENNEISPSIHVRNKRVVDFTMEKPHVANPHQFPYVVYIRKNGFYNCGGFILTPLTIMSAAHCFEDSNAVYHVISNSSDANSGIPHRVQRNIPHLDYRIGFFDNDMALAIISPPINFRESHNRPAVLHDGGDSVGPNTLAFLVGWGCTYTEQVIIHSFVLRAIVVPIVKNDDCRKACHTYSHLTTREMCTLDVNGNKCSGAGDSGDPLIVDGKVVGVMAWRPGFADGRSPDVYANLADADYKKWIFGHIRHEEFASTSG